MKSQKFWLLLVGIILGISGILCAVILHGRPGNATALIYQDGVCIRAVDLNQVDKPYSFTIEWDGGYNVISVERGRICVSEADCPDQICVRQGWISDGVIPIACLPHHLAVRLSAGADAVVDAATG